MDDYRLHVSGQFTHRIDAEAAFSALVAGGLPRERLRLVASGSAPVAPVRDPDSNEVLKQVLVGGIAGSLAGTAFGALAQLWVVGADVALFVASPYVATAAMLGWGASLGGLVGAVFGAAAGEGLLTRAIRKAISRGQVSLVADTRTEQESSIARGVIGASVGGYTETGTA